VKHFASYYQCRHQNFARPGAKLLFHRFVLDVAHLEVGALLAKELPGIFAVGSGRARVQYHALRHLVAFARVEVLRGLRLSFSSVAGGIEQRML
jgi:hypothetical protein